MREFSRRAFLIAVGIAVIPSTAHAHHRKDHQKGTVTPSPVVVVAPTLTITEA